MNPSFRKILYHPSTEMILGIVFCFAVLLGLRALITKPVFHYLIAEKTIADFIINYISTAGLLLSYYYFTRLYEKRKITELSIKSGGIEAGGGFIFGLSVLSLVVLILYLTGHYIITGFSGFSYMLVPFSALVTAAVFEEVIFRLIVYRILENWKGTWLALFVMTIAFTVPHLFNNSVTLVAVLIIIAFSFAVGLMYTLTKRLWLPFAFHLGWNFAQPFYGSNLSGEQTPHIFNAVFKGRPLVIGSEFGIEDSIYSLSFLVLLCGLLIYLSITKGKIVHPLKRRDTV